MFDFVYSSIKSTPCFIRWNNIRAEVILMPKIDENIASARKLRKKLKSLIAGISLSLSKIYRKRVEGSC